MEKLEQALPESSSGNAPDKCRGIACHQLARFLLDGVEAPGRVELPTNGRKLGPQDPFCMRAVSWIAEATRGQ